MNWNSIVQSTSAFAVYMAVMIAYLLSPSPTAFALCLATVLCVGLFVHSMDFASSADFGTDRNIRMVMPSLSESMAELHSLQNEIDELQAQFAMESSAQQNTRDGFSS